MKIVAISDTHGQHHALSLPPGDMIIHAGDVSLRGLLTEVEDFLDWFAELDYRYKVFIAGNHDFLFEYNDPQVIDEMIPAGIVYLNDSGTEIGGLKIWGSPISPFYFNWAFNRMRGAEINQHWDLIPDDMDILITHSPPFGVLDQTIYGEHVGCEELASQLPRIRPAYHIFGHIHEDYGVLTAGETTFVNASVLNVRYELVNKSVVLDGG